jgi:hypothetical protein
MAQERAQERGQQILEPEALPEDPRLLERVAGREGLERLEEAMSVQPLQELLDGVGTTLDPGLAARPAHLVPEAERRGVYVQALAPMIERDRLRAPVGAG